MTAAGMRSGQPRGASSCRISCMGGKVSKNISVATRARTSRLDDDDVGGQVHFNSVAIMMSAGSSNVKEQRATHSVCPFLRRGLG